MKRKKTSAPKKQLFDRVGRRSFLRLAGISTLGTGISGCQRSSSLGGGAEDNLFSSAQEEFRGRFEGLRGRSWRVQILRPEDLLAMEIEFFGLARRRLLLFKPRAQAQAYLTIRFPSQSILESATLEGSDPNQLVVPPRPIYMRLGGPSRLVFEVPKDFRSVPYTLEDVLGLISRCRLVVAPHAKRRNRFDFVSPNFAQARSLRPQTPIQAILELRRHGRLLAQAPSLDEQDSSRELVRPALLGVTGPAPSPTVYQSAIEMPFRLLVSPDETAAFAHRTSLAEHGETDVIRHELWHTRLATRNRFSGLPDESFARLPVLRALETRNYGANDDLPSNTPFSLTQANRDDIVKNTTEFKSRTEWREPIQVNRLMLSSLGGYLDSRAAWQKAPRLLAWNHQAALGRDHYVRTVTRGYLFPFRHEARLVTITERKVVKGVASLYQRSYIVLHEPERSYPPTQRAVPFSKIRFTQLETPNIYGVKAAPEAFGVFLPNADGTAPGPVYLFPIAATDRDGVTHALEAAAVFVPADASTGDVDVGQIPTAQNIYASMPPLNLGRRFALAESLDSNDGVFELASMKLQNAAPENETLFAPAMLEAEIEVEALRPLVGSVVKKSFAFAEPYIRSGFDHDKNPWQTTLALLDAANPAPISFSGNSKNSGGFIEPGVAMRALSRVHGPIGSAQALVANAGNTVASFAAEEYFGDLLNKVLLFGTLPFSAIIDALGGLDCVPKIVSKAIDEGEAFLNDQIALAKMLLDLPEEVVTSQIASIRNQFDEIESAFGDFQRSPDVDKVEALVTSIADLASPLGQLVSVIPALSAPNLTDNLKRRIKTLAAQLRDALDNSAVTFVRKFLEGVEAAKSLSANLEWRPPLKADPLGIFDPVTRNAELILAVEARAKNQPGKAAGVELMASLENFDVVLFGTDAKMLIFSFGKLQFRISGNKKPEIDVIFDDIKFDGILSFVEKLRSILPFSGFSDPPDVDVTSEGIVASFTLPIPNIAVGIFSLENMSLSAQFKLPFIGEPMSIFFGFCSREAPFVLTVAFLGGGGYFGITAYADAAELFTEGLSRPPVKSTRLEAALEFGASLSMDIGVASGSITVVAGVYFSIEFEDGQRNGLLRGYFRMRGEVSVLGLINASIELRMELEYEFETKKLVGRAVIEVEVSVLCFSASVKIEVERKFSGNNDDPTLAEVMDESHWAEYAAAFAA